MTESAELRARRQQALRLFCEQASAAVAAAMRTLLRRECSLRVCRIDLAAACTRQGEPTCWLPLPLAGADDAAQLHVPPPLADVLIDLLMGGSGQCASTRSSLTSIDLQLLKPLIAAAGAALQTQLAQCATGATGASATVDGPPLHLAAALELTLVAPPGTHQLVLTLSPAVVAKVPPLPKTTVQLVAAVGEPADTDDLARLQAGDLLMSESPSGEVIVSLDGKPAFAAQLGQYEGRRAIRITRTLE